MEQEGEVQSGLWPLLPRPNGELPPHAGLRMASGEVGDQGILIPCSLPRLFLWSRGLGHRLLVPSATGPGLTPL
jgi:hypothetical protein